MGKKTKTKTKMKNKKTNQKNIFFFLQNCKLMSCLIFTTTHKKLCLAKKSMKMEPPFNFFLKKHFGLVHQIIPQFYAYIMLDNWYSF